MEINEKTHKGSVFFQAMADENSIKPRAEGQSIKRISNTSNEGDFSISIRHGNLTIASNATKDQAGIETDSNIKIYHELNYEEK